MVQEADLIKVSRRPLSRSAIVAELTKMGLRKGDLVLVHTSLSKLGWVIGGAQSVLEALFEVLGSQGTLVMPGFSSQLSDPAGWSRPPVPADWVAPIRENMPLFDARLTPLRSMGRVAEVFHAMVQTSRSHHPCDSFLAAGPLAQQLLDSHPLANALGQSSPLGKLYLNNARVLLLGAGYGSCTSFHLAEDGLNIELLENQHYPTSRKGGVTQWSLAKQPPTYEEHFEALGQSFEASQSDVKTGFENAARMFPMRSAVDFARNWFMAAAADGKLV